MSDSEAGDSSDPFNFDSKQDEHPDLFKSVSVERKSFGSMKFSISGNSSSSKYANMEKNASGRRSLGIERPKPAKKQRLSVATPVSRKKKATEPLSPPSQPTPKKPRVSTSADAVVKTPKKPVEQAPSLPPEEQAKADIENDKPRVPGARVFAIWGKDYYSAIAANKDGLGRYKVFYTEDQSSRNVPSAGVVPLFCVREGTVVSVVGEKDEDDERIVYQGTVLKIPSIDNVEEWYAGKYKIELTNDDKPKPEVRDIDWFDIYFTESQYKTAKKSVKNPTLLDTSNVIETEGRRPRRSTATPVVVATPKPRAKATPKATPGTKGRAKAKEPVEPEEKVDEVEEKEEEEEEEEEVEEKVEPVSATRSTRKTATPAAKATPKATPRSTRKAASPVATPKSTRKAASPVATPKSTRKAASPVATPKTPTRSTPRSTRKAASPAPVSAKPTPRSTRKAAEPEPQSTPKAAAAKATPKTAPKRTPRSAKVKEPTPEPEPEPEQVEEEENVEEDENIEGEEHAAEEEHVVEEENVEQEEIVEEEEHAAEEEHAEEGQEERVEEHPEDPSTGNSEETKEVAKPEEKEDSENKDIEDVDMENGDTNEKEEEKPEAVEEAMEVDETNGNGNGHVAEESNMIFENMKFILTSANRNNGTPPFIKKDVRKLIENAGGEVVENFEGQEGSKMFLIADTFYRTHKYLTALSLSIPCVSFKWIEESAEERKLLDYKTFMLPAGEIPNEATFEWKPLKEKVLPGKKIVIYSMKGESQDSRVINFFKIWAPMLQNLGATILKDTPTDQEELAKYLQENKPEYMIADDDTSQEVIDAVTAAEGKAVSSEWIIHTIVTGEPADAADPRFQVKSSEC